MLSSMFTTSNSKTGDRTHTCCKAQTGLNMFQLFNQSLSLRRKAACLWHLASSSYVAVLSVGYREGESRQEDKAGVWKDAFGVNLSATPLLRNKHSLLISQYQNINPSKLYFLTFLVPRTPSSLSLSGTAYTRVSQPGFRGTLGFRESSWLKNKIVFWTSR
jgi:hypothetical protein